MCLLQRLNAWKTWGTQPWDSYLDDVVLLWTSVSFFFFFFFSLSLSLSLSFSLSLFLSLSFSLFLKVLMALLSCDFALSNLRNHFLQHPFLHFEVYKPWELLRMHPNQTKPIHIFSFSSQVLINISCGGEGRKETEDECASWVSFFIREGGREKKNIFVLLENFAEHSSRVEYDSRWRGESCVSPHPAAFASDACMSVFRGILQVPQVNCPARIYNSFPT